MARGERVVLVDGSSLIFRAYYAIPTNLRTSHGLHTNAVFGFTTMFRKLLSGRRPAFGAVVFDPPGPTFREERYPEYKADRPRMPQDLVEQLPWIDKVVAAHGFPLLRVPGYEADDVIGTLTRQALAAGHEVFIVSGDKDFAQLIGPDVRMLDTLRDITYDPELVRKKWGVPPEQFVDFLALMGDKVDNIPGVPGIGKKGAAQLLEKYGDLEGILAHTDELKGRKKKALEEHRQLALLSRELATIACDVSLETELAGLALPEVPQAELNGLYRELEFYSLLSEGEQERASALEGEQDHAPLADPAEARALLAAWSAAPDAGAISVLPLFDLPQPPSTLRRLVGLALAPGPPREGVSVARYLPLEGPRATAPLEDEAWAFLRTWLEDPAQPKQAHDAKALWLGLRRRGVRLAGVDFDTRLASFLIDPTKLIPHRLNQVAKEFLHRTVPLRKSVVGSGKQEIAFSAAELAPAAAYACLRVAAVAELGPLLRDKLEEIGLLAHLREHELPLSWVLGEMEQVGVGVDPADLAALGAEFHARLAGLEKQIHGHAGRTFNIASTKQLSKVLFEELKLPVIKRTKTGYSTKLEVLERLAKEHPIAELIVEHRQLAKLINTYTDVLARATDPATGRIHTTFQQTTGATGRLITTDPDLQRTPIRTPEGLRIRRAFVAGPGKRIVSADWSQIELRLMADASRDPLLLEAFRAGVDVHRATAAKLFGVPPADVDDAQRRIGKTVNFATIYGQGATALAQILGIPRKQAQGYIDGFFAAYTGVRAWLDATIANALETGYVSTLLRRRRFIPELASANTMIRQAGTRIAANTPLQGSGADICKLAMLELDRRLRAEAPGTRMVLQIHDELLFEAPVEEVERVSAIAKEVMENVVQLEVPLVADVGAGASWAEAH